MSRYTLIGPDGAPHPSAVPGTLGGHRRTKVYGRLDCAGALRWIAKGHYVTHRVFFADEPTALAAGFRPCARCLPERYAAWKAGAMTVRFVPRQPFDAAHLLGFLAARAVPGVDEVEGTTYRRDGAELRFEPDGTVTADLRGDLHDLVRRCRALLDLDADPDAIAAVLSGERLFRFRPGLRSPGAFDRFEVAVRAIVGQQVSVAGARTVLSRMAADGLFPHPRALARVEPADLPMPRTRGAALVALANGEPLEEIRGVGPWTVGYVRMRCGDPDVFLPTDVAVRRALERAGGDAGAAERWRPFRSYAVHHLWADGAATASTSPSSAPAHTP